MEPTKEFEVHDRVLRKYDKYFEPEAGVITELIPCDLYPSARVLWDNGGTSCIDLSMLKHEQPKDKPEEHHITFYNIQDDIPIGGFAKVGNEVYKVVKEQWCLNCEFMDIRQCSKVQCTSNDRSDGASVSLILYDTIPEDNDE